MKMPSVDSIRRSRSADVFDVPDVHAVDEDHAGLTRSPNCASEE